MAQSAASILAQPLPEFSDLIYIPIIGTLKELSIHYQIAKIRHTIRQLAVNENRGEKIQVYRKEIEIEKLNIQCLEAQQTRSLFSVALLAVCMFHSVFALIIGGAYIAHYVLKGRADIYSDIRSANLRMGMYQGRLTQLRY